MTELNCSVRGCSFNENNMCCRKEIKVGTKNSCCVGETMCESFSNQAMKNACVCNEPDKQLTIKCDAIKCSFNNNHCCTAKSIDIGDSSANTETETKCKSFTLA